MKHALQIATLAMGALTTFAANAASYPNKPVRLVLPYVAGGNTDVLARVMADRMGQSLKQAFVVDNKPGAGGTLATAEVARAQPDGYTLLLATSSTHAINPAVYTKLRYDALKDFAPIGMLALSEYALVVPATSPYKTIGDLLKNNSKEPLRYASNGSGTTSHLAASLLSMKANLDTIHIPYKGSTPAMTDLMGGQVDFLIDNTSTALQQMPSGKIRILATTGRRRADVTKDVPTLLEAGVPDYEIIGWWALMAPAGTPPEIVETLYQEMRKAALDPEVTKRMEAMGTPPFIRNPADTRAFIESDIKKFKAIATSIKLQLD